MPQIRRKIKRGTGKTIPYFTAGTQQAILNYSQATEQREKEKIYKDEILPAFDKLVENLINIYGFVSIDSYDELKSDCMTFLFESMMKFDHTRGTNAFSYFNVVAKHWLIIRSKQRVMKLKNTVSMDDSATLTDNELDAIKRQHIVDVNEIIVCKREAMASIFEVINEVRSKLKTENEFVCIDSIITVFNNIENIDLFTKNAIFLYIKEISGLSQKQLVAALQSIKRHYRDVQRDGKLDFFL